MTIGLAKSRLEGEIRQALLSGFSPQEVHGAVGRAIAKAVADAVDKNNREIERRLRAAGVAF